MSKEKINNLEENCIWEMPKNGESILNNSPCAGCVSNCYLPENMGPEKREFYREGCKSINSYFSR